MRFKVKGFAIEPPKAAKRGFAEVHRLFQHRIENRRDVAGLGIDDLQDFGGRGLPLQRLVTLGFALAKLTLEIGYPLIGIG